MFPFISSVIFFWLTVILIGSVFTTTLQVAFFPFFVVAVIVAVPLFIPFTVPFDTVTTLVLPLSHVISLLTSEFVGLYVTDKVPVSFPFTNKFILVLSKVILAGLVWTFASQVAVFPFAVVAVIVVVPLFTPVIVPFILSISESRTVAISVFILAHVIFLFTFDVSGIYVTLIFSEFIPFTSRSTLVLLNLISVGLVWTFASQVAVFPFAVVAVIVASPFAFPVTKPFCSTVAFPVLLLFHVISLLTFDVTGLYSATTNWTVFVPVKSNVTFVWFNFMLIGLVWTNTLQSAVFPFSVVALIVASPFAFPVIVVVFPVSTTLTTSGLLLVHFIPILAFVSSGI